MLSNTTIRTNPNIIPKNAAIKAVISPNGVNIKKKKNAPKKTIAQDTPSKKSSIFWTIFLFTTMIPHVAVRHLQDKHKSIS